MRFEAYSSASLLFVFFCALLFLTALFRPSWEVGGDGYGYYAYTRSLLYDGDFDFANELAQYDELYGRQTLESWRTPLGSAGNPFAIGPSLLWAPFVLLGYLGSLLGSYHDTFALPGYSLPFQVALAYGTWIYAGVGVYLIFASVRSLFSARSAYIATLAGVFVSPLLYYLIYEPSMSHGLTVFTTGLLLHFSTRVVLHPKHLLRDPVLAGIVFGLISGLLFLVRWQDVLFALIPLWLLALYTPLFHKLHAREQKIQFVLTALVVGVLTIAPQLVLWNTLYGSPLYVPQGAGFFDFTNPHVYEFLFSGFHGLFAVHPLLLLGAGGLFAVHHRYKLLASVLGVLLILTVLFNASLSDWYGGSSFGARRMVSALFIFVVGFAALLTRLNKKRILRSILIALFVVGGVWNLLLMMTYATGDLPLEKPVEVRELYRGPVKIIGL